jgi:hypothetical protein|tara:strand:+ start:62 stop:925 length:864 start_codon:yes stop_codon:yes gene_type:complete
MAEAAVMTEEATPKKVAFMQKPSANQERIKKDEEELKSLLEQKEETTTEEDQEVEPKSAEEKTFKKRYGDLRRHSQQKETELQEQVNALKNQLDESTRKEISLPKSDEDIEAWAKQYPDVAAIVETIAIKKAQEQTKILDKRVKELDSMQLNVTKEKAEAELLRLHPDFNDIRETDDFHNWAEEQPKWVQDALYENDNDARSAARAIDLYKVDMGIGKKKETTSKDAARATNTRNTRSKPQEDDSSDYLRESAVQAMSAKQYEKNQDAIMESIRTGKFVYDISGNAR